MLLRLTALIAATLSLIMAASASPEQTRQLRVGLTYGAPAPTSISLSGTGAAAGERGSLQFKGEVAVSVRAQALVVADKQGAVTTLGTWAEFKPTGREMWLELNKSAYRGVLRVEVADRNHLKVINIVDFEDYVRGVVPNEMFADLEAYKVQAVISRTYAIYVREAEHKHKADGFDICTTGHCQVYRGMDSERLLSDQAVEATRGQVLTYQGRPIFSAYCSNAGGITQPVDEAWPGSIRANFPYLCSVNSPYDHQAEDLQGFSWCYRWEREVSAAEVAKRLRARGKDVGPVCELNVIESTNTQRAKRLEVVGKAGAARLNNPTEIREVLGLPSERFTYTRTPLGFKLTGWGFGHGVGLSQHGALGMSKAGYRYDEILGHYYRGVALAEDYAYGSARALTPPEITTEAAQVRPTPVPAGIG